MHGYVFVYIIYIGSPLNGRGNIIRLRNDQGPVIAMGSSINGGIANPKDTLW